MAGDGNNLDDDNYHDDDNDSNYLCSTNPRQIYYKTSFHWAYFVLNALNMLGCRDDLFAMFIMNTFKMKKCDTT